jgi:hypothetical protein
MGRDENLIFEREDLFVILAMENKNLPEMGN